jgi:hypothetical protein
MTDKKAYQKMYGSINQAQRNSIDQLFGELTKLNGALWLVDDLEQRAKDLTNDAYKKIKTSTGKE